LYLKKYAANFVEIPSNTSTD